MKKQFTALATLLPALTVAAAINIDTAYVGDVGNPATEYYPRGSVGYGYYIGTYEVTNSQYVSFLNATAATNAYESYNSNMGSSVHGGISQSGSSGSFSYSARAGMGNKPVNYVSFWDAARFANWLTSGDTEVGVYDLEGVVDSDAFGSTPEVSRDPTAWEAGGVGIASVNEWYKAAYYQPVAGGGDADGYWLYPNASNSMTTADANVEGSVGTVTDVDAYSHAVSYYGTYGQAGNVSEMHDGSGCDPRGGNYDFGDYSSDVFTGVGSEYYPPHESDSWLGFRVTSLAPIPEPSTYAAIFGGFALLFAIVRRIFSARR